MWKTFDSGNKKRDRNSKIEQQKGVGGPQLRDSRGLTTRMARWGSYGNAVTRKKAEKLDGASGVFARGPVARRSGRLLETSASLLRIDGRLNSATVSLGFRSPRSPP
eukprot:3571441-Pleurochrysis_carterae.AAC.1